MTTQNDLDRDLEAWFDSRIASHEPVGLLDATLARVSDTRQRPRWFGADWRLSVWESRSDSGRPWPVRLALPLLVLGLLLALLAVAAAGVLQRRLPANGVIAYSQNGQIYILEPGGGRRTLDGGSLMSSRLVWSPDESRIAYWSETYSGTIMRIAHADGTGVVEEAVPSHCFDFPSGPVWTLEGSAASPCAEGVVSPDGTLVVITEAFGEPVQAGSRSFRLLIAARDGSNRTLLTDPPAGDLFAGDPAWSPDGDTIAFMGWIFDPRWVAGQVTSTNGIPMARRQLYLIGADGGGLRKLTGTQPEPLDGPTWSPDGRHIAFTGRDVCCGDAPLVIDGSSGLYVMDPDGSGTRRIVQGDLGAVTWSPDGRLIAFASYNSHGDPTDLPIGIYTVGPDGSGLTKVGDLDPGDPVEELSWQPVP